MLACVNMRSICKSESPHVVFHPSSTKARLAKFGVHLKVGMGEVKLFFRFVCRNIRFTARVLPLTKLR